MWSEYVSAETIDSRIWPRTLAVAERLWSPANTTDVRDFYRRMEVESARLEEVGLTHRSNYVPMLKNLVGKQPVQPFKVLADVVEPLKLYERYHQRNYNFDLPLTNLVDAARPESDAARVFRWGVEDYLAKAPNFGKGADLKSTLERWKDNHGALEPILKRADLYNIATQSRDLSVISKWGLEALDALRSGHQASDSWETKALQALDRAQQPQAEVELAVISPIRHLVLAAAQMDKLKKLSAKDWNQSLGAQVKAAKRKSWE